MHLETILDKTRQTVEQRKRLASLKALEKQAAAHQPRGFVASLAQRSRDGYAIIAELKKASPSKGLIRADFEPGFLAQSLERGGAAALSVLTDESFFQGSLRNLEIASSVTTIPCLRKDFIIDEFQILEARASAADAVLLIAAALKFEELDRLTKFAHSVGLEVLCEVHTAKELDGVGGFGCDAYGVNNRDLVSFEVRLETSEKLGSSLPEGALRVAESGLNTPEDLRRLKRVGFDAFLIGESLMRKAAPGSALAALLAAAYASPVR
ncbi:MAG TPA: indole-3-glycerol phosphate synthase TrpC [Acidisarcina sp.]